MLALVLITSQLNTLTTLFDPNPRSFTYISLVYIIILLLLLKIIIN